MPYSPKLPNSRLVHLAFSCPFRFSVTHCGGGDYCDFPEGRDRLCCFYCPRFESCPDPDGVCQHFMET